MASTNSKSNSTTAHVRIDALHKGSDRVVWSLVRGDKIVVTDIAENRKAAQQAARTAFAKELLKQLPALDGTDTTDR